MFFIQLVEKQPSKPSDVLQSLNLEGNTLKSCQFTFKSLGDSALFTSTSYVVPVHPAIIYILVPHHSILFSNVTARIFFHCLTESLDL